MKKYVCINVSLVCFGTWTPGQAPFLWVLEIMMHERYQIIGTRVEVSQFLDEDFGCDQLPQGRKGVVGEGEGR